MIINPKGLYSEGQGIFNSTPFTQFAIQQQAKQDAKNEALDKYYQDLPKSINSAGLRNQDTGGFIDKINGIRDFYAKNREAIKNPRLDRGKAQSEYQARNTDASMYVNQSKAEELKKAPFVKILANPDMRDRVMDSDLQKLHQHDLPLNDPNRKSFDFSTIDFNPKEYTPEENQSYAAKLTSDLKPNEKIISSIPDPKTLTITNTYQKQWSPAQLKSIADKDLGNVTSDRRLEYSAEQTWQRLKDNPDQFNKYNDIYKQLYGKNIEHPAELHAAMQVAGRLGDSNREVSIPDENARDLRNAEQARQAQQRGFNHADQMQARLIAHQDKAAREKLGVGDSTNINDIYQNIEEATDNPNAAILQNGNRVGTRVNILNADAQKVVVDYANKLRPNEKIGNDNIFLDKEADGTVKIYRTDDSDENHKGEIIKDEAHLIGELPKVTANLPAQPGVKEKRAVIAQGKTPVKNPDASIHINDVPAGTKLVQKKGKYYYNGKEVITE